MLKEAQEQSCSARALNTLQVDKTALLVEVAPHSNRNLELSARNLEGVELIAGNQVHPYHLLRYDRVIFSHPAIREAAGFAQEFDFRPAAARPPKVQARARARKAARAPRRRTRHEKAAEVA